MSYHWDWLFLFREADDGRLYLAWVLEGWALTVGVAAVAFVLALTLGTLVGTGRTVSSRTIRAFCTVHTELFRNVPLLVQLFIWYFVVPELLPAAPGSWMKTEMPAFALGAVGLGLYTSARIAEQVRAGLSAIPRGQKAAGLALGFTGAQTYRLILLPNAARRIWPALTTEAMAILKNSSVTFAVGVYELTFQYRQIIEKTAQVIEMTAINTGLYMASAVLIYAAATWLEIRSTMQRPEPQGRVRLDVV